MKKRKFLVPVTVALAALTGTAQASSVDGIADPATKISVSSAATANVRQTIGDDFVIRPNAGEAIQTAYHRSHLSHSSHSSHRSHYSSYR
jgi:hypothetical protein